MIPPRQPAVTPRKQRRPKVDPLAQRAMVGFLMHIGQCLTLPYSQTSTYKDPHYSDRGDLQCDLILVQKAFPFLSPTDRRTILEVGLGPASIEELAQQQGITAAAIHQRLFRIAGRILAWR